MHSLGVEAAVDGVDARREGEGGQAVDFLLVFFRLNIRLRVQIGIRR